ncbi:MAG: HAD family phosphatase [Desulfobacterales bacterium]|jgi:putative hydrolase of the HAD superfamily
MGKTRIRALVLDYGGVISKPQNPENLSNMLQIINKDESDFRIIYREKRDNYDNGQLSGEEYWHSILQHYGLEQNGSNVTKLIQEDIESWTQINDSMIQFIKESRKKVHTLAIISNMTGDCLAYMKKHFQWLALFDELTFSCEFGKNKPDPKIYQAFLSRIEIPPQGCLFVDDLVENVDGAMKSGMNVIHFKSFLKFRQELEQNYRFSQ